MFWGEGYVSRLHGKEIYKGEFSLQVFKQRQELDLPWQLGAQS